MPRTAAKSLNIHFSETWSPPLFGTASKGYLRGIERAARKPFFVTNGRGHENLQQAIEILYRYGRSLDSFQKLIFVVRNPYSLVFSNYKFLRSIAGVNSENKNATMASEGTFEDFCKNFRHPNPSNWVRLASHHPSNLHILKFEQLRHDVVNLEEELGLTLHHEIPHLNKSGEAESINEHMTEVAEAIIYERYSELFQLGQYVRGRW